MSKISTFKVFNLDTKEYELGSFFLSDEGNLYEQEISWSEIVINPVEFNYRVEFENE